VADAAAAGPPAAAAAGAVTARAGSQDLDVLALTLADSPEPQPLLSRLARVTAGSHPQQQSRQPTSGSSRQGVRAGGSVSNGWGPGSSANSGAEGASQEQQRVRQRQAHPQSQPHQQVTMGSDIIHRVEESGEEEEEEDDFQPRSSNTRSRLTAARASSALVGAAGARRVVPGLRPSAVRRPARSSRA
jgi:hypothetical protein